MTKVASSDQPTASVDSSHTLQQLYDGDAGLGQRDGHVGVRIQ